MMMNNQPQTNLLDTAVPSIGVETLRPTPFKRHIQSKKKKNSAAKVANAAKKKTSSTIGLSATFHRAN